MSNDRHVERVYQRTCGRKCHFLSRAAAKKAIDRLDGNKRGLRPYNCPFCGDYHIGHKKRPNLPDQD
jgi:hypothetical protein